MALFRMVRFSRLHEVTNTDNAILTLSHALEGKHCLHHILTVTVNCNCRTRHCLRCPSKLFYQPPPVPAPRPGCAISGHHSNHWPGPQAQLVMAAVGCCCSPGTCQGLPSGGADGRLLAIGTVGRRVACRDHCFLPALGTAPMNIATGRAGAILTAIGALGR
jgi:hypothetical protein